MTILIILTGLFLPLFPLNIISNHNVWQNKSIWGLLLLLILRPLIGIMLFTSLDVAVPDWILLWAAATSLLYAFRMLTQRELNTWISYLATSIWSLLWFLLAVEESVTIVMIYAFCSTIPLTILLLLAAELQQRFGAAYTHLYSGLTEVMPRFSGVLVFVLLAALATPVFPGFFVMLKVLAGAVTLAPPLVSIMVLLSWLLWSWAGVRVLQGLLVGRFNHDQAVTDLSEGRSRGFALVLVLLALAGLFIMGGMA